MSRIFLICMVTTHNVRFEYNVTGDMNHVHHIVFDEAHNMSIEHNPLVMLLRKE